MAELRSASLSQFPSTSQACENPALANKRLRKTSVTAVLARSASGSGGLVKRRLLAP